MACITTVAIPGGTRGATSGKGTGGSKAWRYRVVERVGVLGEREPAGQQLVEHHPGGVDVGRRRQLLGLGLLGRHVRGRAEHLSRLGRQRLVAADHLGDAEVRDLQHLRLAEQEVLGLDVSVQDALRVGALHGGAGGESDGTGGVHRHALAGEPAPDGAAGELLHHQEAEPVELDEVVHGHDVGMVEAGEQAGLGHEAGSHRGVGGEGAGQLLDRDHAVQLLVTTLQHDAPAASSELTADVVRGQGGGDEITVEGHRSSAPSAVSPTGGPSRSPSPSSSSSSGDGVR